MIIVGLPYTAEGLVGVDQVSGGSPYGASTIAGTDHARQPSDNEIDLARAQGKHVAEVALRQSLALEIVRSLA